MWCPRSAREGDAEAAPEPTAEGLEGLRRTLDATRRGLLTGATKEAAVISIIKWCKEDSTSFSRIVSELGEEERTPAVRESLAYANALYSGYSDGYSAS